MVRRLPKGVIKMESFELSHPQAAAAVYLAQVAHLMDRATLRRQLQRFGVSAQLFTLARVLRAATAKGL